MTDTKWVAVSVDGESWDIQGDHDRDVTCGGYHQQTGDAQGAFTSKEDAELAASAPDLLRELEKLLEWAKPINEDARRTLPFYLVPLINDHVEAAALVARLRGNK